MSKDIIPANDDYKNFLKDIKSRVQTAQTRAMQNVNSELIELYWQIGNESLSRQENEGWGTKVTKKLSVDLKSAFPDMKGFSEGNLRYMQRFAASWPICPPVVGKLGWKHNRELIYNNCLNPLIELHLIGIKPECQQLGYGTTLLQAIVEFYQSRDDTIIYSQMRLESPYSVARLFARCGFEEIEARVIPNYLDCACEEPKCNCTYLTYSKRLN
jgi:GNAT superfamily N-acetyltransferase